MRIETLIVGLVVMVAAVACKDQERTSDRTSSSEQAYVERGVASLETALANGDESRVLVECVAVRTGVERMPASLANKIHRLCYVEAPRLLLSNAIADVKKHQAAHPDQRELNCMQLLVSDAYEWMAKQEPVDPEVQQLADEYARLCPDQAAKARTKAEAKARKQVAP